METTSTTSPPVSIAIGSLKLGVMFASSAWNLPNQIAEAVTLCEGFGVESVWAVEHVMTPLRPTSAYPYSETGELRGLNDAVLCDPVVWLTYAAALSSTLRLGTGIMILPQRHPAYVAKEWATLDRLSGGRALLGVGVGWLEEEMEAVGVPFAERGARMDEAIAAIRSLWAPGPSTFHGRFFNWDEMTMNPRPDRTGSVPIIVGGHSPAALLRAARLGDGFFWPGNLSRSINASDDGGVARLIARLKQECEAIDRDPTELEITVGAAGADADEIGRLHDLGVDRIVIGAPPVEQLEQRLERFTSLLR